MAKAGKDLVALLLALLIVVEAFLLLFGLGNEYLWEDEANTASFGANVLKSGLPTAWDGVNLLAHHDGLQLSDDLLSKEGWVQYYLIAGSFALFGRTTFAARFPFALLGLATVVTFYFFAKSYLEDPRRALLCTLFLALSVPFLLYARASRYYSPAMFLATACWLLSLDLSVERRAEFVLFVICCVMFFHTNYVIFAAFFAALVLWNAMFAGRKKWLLALASSVPPILCLTLPWYLWVKPHRGAGPYFLANLWRGNPFYLFYGHLRDFNVFGFFPALMAVVLIVLGLSIRKRNRFLASRLWGAVAFILIFTFILSLLSPQVLLRGSYVDMRYAAVLLPAFALVLGVLCYEVARYNTALGAALIVLVLLTDLLTLRQFLPMYPVMVNVSSPLPLPFNCYLGDYIYEITHHRKTPSEAVATWLAPRIRPGETAITSPPDVDSSLVFYLGDTLRFCGQLREDGPRFLPTWRGKLPAYVYSGQVAPDWVIYFTKEGIREDIADWINSKDVHYEIFLLRELPA